MSDLEHHAPSQKTFSLIEDAEEVARDAANPAYWSALLDTAGLVQPEPDVIKSFIPKSRAHEWARELAGAIMGMISTDLYFHDDTCTQTVDQLLAQLRAVAAQAGATLSTQAHLARALQLVHAEWVDISLSDVRQRPRAEELLTALRTVARRVVERPGECEHRDGAGGACPTCTEKAELATREYLVLALAQSHAAALHECDIELADRLLEELIHMSDDEWLPVAVDVKVDALLAALGHSASVGTRVAELMERLRIAETPYARAAYGLALLLTDEPQPQQLKGLLQRHLEDFRRDYRLDRAVPPSRLEAW